MLDLDRNPLRRLNAMRDLEPDEQTSVRTDALPAVSSDIRAWCRTAGHELTGVEERDTERRFGIRKPARPRAQPPWALVISYPGLEELLSPLGFALAAVLGGSQVAIYFHGPALRVPTHGFQERLKGPHRAPFSRFARRGLARTGHPPPHEKLAQLDELRARLYVCGPSMQHFKVDSGAAALPRDQNRRLPHLRRADADGGRADLPSVARGVAKAGSAPQSSSTSIATHATPTHQPAITPDGKCSPRRRD